MKLLKMIPNKECTWTISTVNMLHLHKIHLFFYKYVVSESDPQSVTEH